MDLGLNIAASGMLTEQVRQDALSNDLANASTPGYKTDTAEQQSFGALLMANTVTGQQIGPIETGVAIGKVVTNLTPSTLQSTGQALDFGISGQGFFGVQTAQGVRYTRDGQFSAGPAGTLVDSHGDQVLGQSGAPIRVGSDGKVTPGTVGVFNLTAAVKQGQNMFTGTVAGRAGGIVRAGMLESSSVDAVHTMVDMIASLRSYEASQKAIQSIDETLQQASSSVGSLGSGA